MLNVGDFVCIKKDIQNIEATRPLGISDEMCRFENYIFAVKAKHIKCNWYVLDNPEQSWDWYYDENWLEPLHEINVTENDWNVMFQS